LKHSRLLKQLLQRAQALIIKSRETSYTIDTTTSSQKNENMKQKFEQLSKSRAKNVAQHEVLKELSEEEEGRRVDKDMLAEKLILEEWREKAITDAIAKDQVKTSLKVSIGWSKISSFLRIWHAKLILRKKSQARYTKRFHPDFHRFYYQDVNNVSMHQCIDNLHDFLTMS